MPSTGRLFEIIWQVDREWMPTIRELCNAQEARGKSVTRLESIEDLDAFTRAN